MAILCCLLYISVLLWSTCTYSGYCRSLTTGDSDSNALQIGDMCWTLLEDLLTLLTYVFLMLSPFLTYLWSSDSSLRRVPISSDDSSSLDWCTASLDTCRNIQYVLEHTYLTSWIYWSREWTHKIHVLYVSSMYCMEICYYSLDHPSPRFHGYMYMSLIQLLLGRLVHVYL